MKISYYFLLVFFTASLASNAQELYVPGGASNIGNSGNDHVGIGTPNPTVPLEIEKSATSGEREEIFKIKISDAASDYFDIINSTGANGQFIPMLRGYHVTDNRIVFGLRAEIDASNDNGTEPMLIFNSRVTDALVQNRPLFAWKNYNQTKMTMLANGNLGIGTTSPSHLLEIRGKTMLSNVGGEALLLNPDGQNRRGIVSSNFQLAFIADKVNSLNSDKTIVFGSGGETPDDPNFRAYMTINQGKVGIGTTNYGSHKLSVNGTIRAEEVRVEAVPQSDYVFEPDYNLLPLTEVEAFIKENKHLPEIPSAEEFKENGVGLGEMDDMLLRKVEELTLYIIQQNRELEELQIENEQLQTENSNKGAKINSLEEKVDRILEMLEASK